MLGYGEQWSKNIMDINMKNFHKIISIASLLVFSISGCASELSKNRSWTLSGIYGGQFKISYQKDSSMYAVTVGDVTVKVESCGDALLKLCIQSPSFDIVIPKKKPSVGESWQAGNGIYKLESRLDNMQFLGRVFEDVFVISSEREEWFTGRSLGLRRYELFYSYVDGLIFFKVISGPNAGLFLISTQIPSIGSD